VRGTPVLALKVWLEDGISTSSMSGGSGDNWPGRLKGSGR
jgi:hypothetical protein